MDFVSTAYAMGSLGGGNGAGQQGAGGLTAFVPLILMGVIFYFLLIRPQQKKQKETRNMLSSLKRGDRVRTAGGLHGTITGITDTVVTLEIAEKVRVKVDRNYVAAVTAKDAGE
ncbi:MAG TPA: preprotein translocase subunit YajC [Syntrophobacteraceae bacterium]|jgi:preprotein translocase subunit YajC|nr:preprotein translocase subunit YajC [Syntrophobacteraceae bacterium]HBD09072.1 preprotein translocase subunit YajC [Syntrophobacteraceae bacterium]HBZ54514.1 preprotein translocase subunit YajC [Syntrophobacteraceae bacterium]